MKDAKGHGSDSHSGSTIIQSGGLRGVGLKIGASFPSQANAMRPGRDFKNDADALIAILKALPRQTGFDEISMPGERSGRTEAQRRKSGIPIPPKLWEVLEKIAKDKAIKGPVVLS